MVYILGLLDVLSELSKCSIEKPGEIVVLFQNKQSEITDLRNKIKFYEAGNDKLKQEIGEIKELNETYYYRLNRLILKEQELKEKEKEFAALLVEKHADKILYDSLTMKLAEYQQQIKNLEIESKENVKKLNELSPKEEPVYINYTDSLKNLLSQCQLKLQTVHEDLQTKEEDLNFYKQETSRYRIKKETLEDLLEKQKIEHNHVFNELHDKLDAANKQNYTYINDFLPLQEKVKILELEKVEAKKKLINLSNVIYERENTLKDVQIKLSATEKDKASSKVSLKRPL